MSSGSGFNRPSPVDDGEPEYDKIIISALTLLVVVLLVFCLHVYARWIWVQSVRFSWRSRRRAASRRRQFYFSGEEPARLKNVGLDSATLESLPMFVYRSKNFTDGLDCAVCLCDFKEDEKARLLPNCKHSFHVECIDMWFISHSTCPLCRTGAQPEEPVLKSAGIDQISATIREPIASEIHENLNSEQGQTASSEEEYNVPNPTNLLSRCRPEQTNAEIDEGSSGGRALMAYVAIEIPMRPDGLWFPGEAHQHCSPNGSQSASKSPVTHLRSLTNMFNRDTERKVFPSDHTGEFDVENHGPEQGQ